MKTQNVGFVKKTVFLIQRATRRVASRRVASPQGPGSREARSSGVHKRGDRQGKGQSSGHKAGDRKGKAQSTPHAVGARIGKTSFRVTVAPGAGIEFVDVGMQCPSNVI